MKFIKKYWDLLLVIFIFILGVVVAFKIGKLKNQKDELAKLKNLEVLIDSKRDSIISLNTQIGYLIEDLNKETPKQIRDEVKIKIELITNNTKIKNETFKNLDSLNKFNMFKDGLVIWSNQYDSLSRDTSKK